jgi:hypothetical protein
MWLKQIFDKLKIKNYDDIDILHESDSYASLRVTVVM